MASTPTCQELAQKIIELERERDRQEQLLESFLKIAGQVEVDRRVLLDLIMSEISSITKSPYAFYGVMDQGGRDMAFFSWPREVLADGLRPDEPLHVSMDQAGIWAEAVSAGKAIIVNDYTNDHGVGPGLPMDVLSITRLLAIPVFRDDRITAMAVVANKEADYTEEEVRQAEIFVTGVQPLLNWRQSHERHLAESERRLRYILRHDPNAIAVYDRDLRYIAVSDRYLVDYNVTEQEVIGKNHYEVFPEMPQRWKDVHQRVLQGAVEKNDDDHFDRPDGSRTYNRWECRPWYDQDGGIGGMITYTEVTTARKLMEQALKESETILNDTGRMARIGGWEHDLATGRAVWTAALYDILEIDSGVPPGVNEHLDYYPPRDRRILEAAYGRSVEEGLPFDLELQCYTGKGRLRWWRATGEPVMADGRCVKMRGTFQDITARKRAEEDLVKSEEQYRDLVENAHEGIWKIDKDGMTIFVNRRMAEMLGYTKNEMSGRLIFHFMDDKAKQEAARNLERRKSGLAETHEFRFKKKDGSDCWTIVSARPVLSETGDFSAVQAFITDITDRKQAEYALQESGEKYRHLFELESDAVLLIRKEDGQILEANRAAADLYGYSREELLSLKNTDLSAEPDKTAQATAEQKSTIPIRYHKRKDGTTVVVEITASHFKWRGVDVHVAAIRDITVRLEAEKEKARLEKQLYQSQKMESIGKLAGGIAHDFNNILSSIIGFTELALEDVDRDSSVADNLREVFSAGKRARDLVKQILTFARQSDEEIKPIQAETIVREVLKFIRSFIPSTIDVQAKIESNAVIMGNPTQVHQIFLNLCTNAAQAMEENGGILEIGLRDVRVDDQHAMFKSGLKSGPYLEITVSDTGDGIPPDIIGSIFDPYFTTKAPGKGTGMGLAMVHGIVESYGGTIRVDSTPGQGAIFQIYLPVVNRSGHQTAGAEEVLPTGTEHILVVDDEAAIVDFERRALERLGYRVTTRTGSLDALKLFLTAPQAFDLVITDITMPHLTGDRLAMEMMAVRPDLPVITVTGYSQKMSEDRAAELGIKAFAFKPIVMGDLARTVRKVLDEAYQKTENSGG
jgi:PAS domain S-box-containing protein